jgi:phosphonoacetaldehyde hydrolase
MFRNFIPLQLDVIAKYSDIVPELPEALTLIRSLNMKIGSTTGYNREMMKIVTDAATAQGYTADSVVCASDVPAGRPAPWMAFRNAENLGIFPMRAIVKIGDTLADIEEGLNAGMWSVGVVTSSNEMGLSRTEIESLSEAELEERRKMVRQRYFKAGAHYVIETLSDIGELFEAINQRLAAGERP